MTTDEKSRKEYLNEALKEAQTAFDEGEVPVGCVIIKDGKILARAHNTVEREGCALRHAELNAIEKASSILGSKYLDGCIMYVTLEPCAMCAGAIVNARIGQLYYGIEEPKTGCCESNYNIVEDGRMLFVTPKINLHDERCGEIMKEFFDQRRDKC